MKRPEIFLVLFAIILVFGCIQQSKNSSSALVVQENTLESSKTPAKTIQLVVS